MGAIWGRQFTFTIFGESHGPAIGGVIGGLPAGMSLNMEEVMVQMNRRRPGGSTLGTPRSEADEPEILSGLLKGVTTGSPLTFVIRNNNTRSDDYNQFNQVFRPSHADYTASIRYKGFNDIRGGGHFSGRLTACLTFAGAVAKQILSKKGIRIGGRISQIGPVLDEEVDFAQPPMARLCEFSNEPMGGLSVLNEKAALAMTQIVEDARAKGDSVGGIVEVYADGLEAGLGDPFFDSIESQLASLVYAVPAVKGVEFGSGMKLASMYGSEANDRLERCIARHEHKEAKTVTNHAGGLLGGITSGMPIVMRVGFKPTPSIGLPQMTWNNDTEKMDLLTIQGRHDPCVAIRALPVIEACMAMVLLDEWMIAKGYME